MPEGDVLDESHGFLYLFDMVRALISHDLTCDTLKPQENSEISVPLAKLLSMVQDHSL